jgi:hypothetical protein
MNEKKNNLHGQQIVWLENDAFFISDCNSLKILFQGKAMEKLEAQTI